jgi:hypothetical protein
MSGPPDAPDTIPEYILDALDRQDSDTLRQIATHATALADHHEQPDDDDQPPSDVEDSDMPEDDDVPAKASIVTKTINDNQYYYWQWRDGDQIKSKYKAPVNPDE